MRLTWLIVLVGGVLLCAACGDQKAGGFQKPGTAGTAEQLAGTKWDTGGGTLEFLSATEAQFAPKEGNNPRLPAPTKALTGNYSVTEGMVSGLIDDTIPIAGTWDGEKLVVGGKECKRVSDK